MDVNIPPGGVGDHLGLLVASCVNLREFDIITVFPENVLRERFIDF
jgi:hypothetical protein